MARAEGEGTVISLYDDFIKSIEETSAEELLCDIEKAEKDSKNIYLLDES